MAKKQDQEKKSQVPSIKNVDIEQPLKGMNQDMSTQTQPDGTYRFALNAVNNTEEGQQGFLSTEEGNFKCMELDHNPTIYIVEDLDNIPNPPVASPITLTGNWLVIGHVYVGEDRIIVFLTGEFIGGSLFNGNLSRIIEFNIDTCETKILLTSDCLNFDIDHQIQGVHRIRKGCERNLYFTDNNNEPRQMNLDSLDNYLKLGVPPISVWENTSFPFESVVNIWDCKTFRLFPLVEVPNINYIRTDDSGGFNMKPGTYQVCIRYLDSDLNPTRFFDICNPIPIYNDITEPQNISFHDIEGSDSYSIDDDGVATGRLTTKSIVYNFTRLDTSYSYVDVIVIPSTTGTGMNDGIAYIVDTIPIIGQTSLQYRFRGIDPEIAKEITLEEVLVPNIGYAKAKTIEQSENRLLLGNLTSNAIDHAAFQKAANNITSKYITKTVNAFSKTDTPKGGDYYFDGRSYMRDEVYSFAVVWVFNDGSESPAYHIPGRAMNLDDTRNNIGANDINHPIDPFYDATLGAEHNRELCSNAVASATITSTGANSTSAQWDGASYLADTHNMSHITSDGTDDATNNPTYQRWKVYNTAIRDQASFDATGDTFFTEGQMAYWESEDHVYPDLRDCDGNVIYEITTTDQFGNVTQVEDLTGQPIRHHKMPDTTLEPHFYGNSAEDPYAYPNVNGNGGNAIFRNNSEKLSILGVRFNNVFPPVGNAFDGESWDQKVQGYKIVKQERTNLDKTVLDKGIIYYNYQARTYSSGGGGNVVGGGAIEEFCMQTDAGGAVSDIPCHFWFQGNHYNKHIGFFRSNDNGNEWWIIGASNTSWSPDENPYEVGNWNVWWNGDLQASVSLLVPSGCDSVGAFNNNANSCTHGTDCGRCESTTSACKPYSNIEWGGTDWNGGQSSGWNSWASWPFHNANTLTIGSPNTDPSNFTSATGSDTRQFLSGSFTNNLSYHGAITKFVEGDPNPTYIKIERTLEGILYQKDCYESDHMTGCDPTTWWTGQTPEGSYIASVCRYNKSIVPYYNITQGVPNMHNGHFTWPNHNFPLSNRTISNSFGTECEGRVDGGISDFGSPSPISSIDNCHQGDAFVVELTGNTQWNNFDYGMPIPGFNTGFSTIRDDNSNVGECRGGDHNPTDANNNVNTPDIAPADNDMNNNDVYSTCHYVSLKVNNPAQYGPILSAIYIPSSNNLTYRDDADFNIPNIGNPGPVTWLTPTPSTSPYGPNFDLSTTEEYNGDIFISRLAFRKHGHFKKCAGNNAIFLASSQVAYLVTRQTPYFFIESEINTDLRHGGNLTEERWYPYNFEGNNTLNVNNFWHDKENLGLIAADTAGVREVYGWDGIDNAEKYGFPGDYPVMCEQYNYNQDYSKLNNENKYFGLPLGFDYCSDCYTNFPHRIVYSIQAFQEETADNFRVFTSESYTDIPGHRGDITNIFTLNNKLYAHTEESLWTLFTSQETLQTTEGTEVALGTGAFLSKPPREIIEAQTGYGGSVSQWASLNTSQGTFFVDATDGKVFLLGEKLQNISASGMSNWFEEHIPFILLDIVPNFIQVDNPANPIGIGYIVALDRNNQRVIVTKKDYRPRPFNVQQGMCQLQYIVNDSKGRWRDNISGNDITNPYERPDCFENLSWTASYSLLTGSWTSFHSYLPTNYIVGKDTFQSIINNHNNLVPAEGKHDVNLNKNNYLRFYGTIEKFIIDTISTTNPLITETYENYHYHSKAKEYDSQTNQWIDLRNITFDQVILYNDYQCTRLLDFNKRIDNQSNMLGSIQNNPNQILLDIKERVWSFNGFRDMILDRNQSMFTTDWNNTFIQSDYFIDKVINPIAFIDPVTGLGTRPWNEQQKFRDKYLGIRLIFSNLAGSLTIPKITFNYLQSGMTKSSR